MIFSHSFPRNSFLLHPVVPPCKPILLIPLFRLRTFLWFPCENPFVKPASCKYPAFPGNPWGLQLGSFPEYHYRIHQKIGVASPSSVPITNRTPELFCGYPFPRDLYNCLAGKALLILLETPTPRNTLWGPRETHGLANGTKEGKPLKFTRERQ